MHICIGWSGFKQEDVRPEASVARRRLCLQKNFLVTNNVDVGAGTNHGDDGGAATSRAADGGTEADGEAINAERSVGSTRADADGDVCYLF